MSRRLMARWGGVIAPTYDESRRISFADPCTTTPEQRAAARLIVTEHSRDQAEADTLIDMMGIRE